MWKDIAENPGDVHVSTKRERDSAGEKSDSFLDAKVSPSARYNLDVDSYGRLL